MVNREGNDMLKGEVPTGWGEEQRRSWHIDKSINVTAVAGIAGMVFTVCFFFFGLGRDTNALDMRIGIVEKQLTAEREYRDRQRAEDRETLQRALTDLQIQIRSMDSKVDSIRDKVGATK